MTLKHIYLFFLSLLLLSSKQGQAQCLIDSLYDFESGSYSPEFTNVGSQVFTVNTTNPAVGTYKLEGTGGSNSHLSGLTTTVSPAATPSSISWYIYPTGSVSTNYVVIGDASLSATNCVAFFYWQGGASAIRFVSSSSITYVTTANQWHFIEMRNIDWVNHVFDAYIDSVLVGAAFPFRSTTQNSVEKVHLYNFNSGTAAWDQLKLGVGNPVLLTDFITTPLCNGGSNGAIDLSVSGGTAPYIYQWSNTAVSEDITGLFAGNYDVTVTDAVGCEEVATYTITEPTAISLTQNIVLDVSCNAGNDGIASINAATGGTASYTYDWEPGTPSGDGTTDIMGLNAGVWTCSVTDGNGCTQALNITVSEPAAINIVQTFTLCSGDSLAVGSNIYTMSGTYTDILTSVGGCDSTVQTNVTINGAISSTQNINLCSGDSLTVGSNTYTASGSYTDIFTAVNGCDSTVITNLTVNGSFNSSENINICNGDSYTIGGVTYTASGVYASLLTSLGGCDSLVITTLVIDGEIRDTQNVSICAGESLTVGSNIYTIDGTYTDILTSTNGCDSTIITNLTVEDSISTIILNVGNVLTANAFGDAYQWVDCDNGNQPIAGEINQSFTPTVEGNYAAIVTVGACSQLTDCSLIVGVDIITKTTTPIKIYPNPNTGNFIISGAAVGVYRLTNTLGQIIESISVQTENSVEVSVSNIIDGVYYLFDEHGAMVNKIVVITQ